jgi:transglutaminase-like putative cysteine protease
MDSIYRIRHLTRYRYGERVLLSHNVLHLSPRSTPVQRTVTHQLSISPTPSDRREHSDPWGNRRTVIIIDRPHDELEVEALSTVVVSPRSEADDIPWEVAADAVRQPGEPAACAASEAVLPSRHCPRSPALAALGQAAFPPGVGVRAGLLALCSAIRADFAYRPGTTTINTGIAEVLAARAGVCQDFAHLAIAAARSVGLAARYVSGYLETDPPVDRPRLVGADASHAWLQIWAPGLGWIDGDPTNGCLVGERHATIAWGRDFSDVSPLSGLVLGGGQATVTVGVDVERLDGPETGGRYQA